MTNAMTTRRRTVAGGLLAAPAMLYAAGGPARAAAAPERRPFGQGSGPREPGAGGWSTWVLANGGELQPPPPPGGTASGAELAELRALAARRDGAALDAVAYWDAGAPGYRWNELATALSIRAPVAVRGYRTLALVNVAIHDATVAAWAAKYALNRPPARHGRSGAGHGAAHPAEPIVPGGARRGGGRRGRRAGPPVPRSGGGLSRPGR